MSRQTEGSELQRKTARHLSGALDSAPSSHVDEGGSKGRPHLSRVAICLGVLVVLVAIAFGVRFVSSRTDVPDHPSSDWVITDQETASSTDDAYTGGVDPTSQGAPTQDEGDRPMGNGGSSLGGHARSNGADSTAGNGSGQGSGSNPSVGLAGGSSPVDDVPNGGSAGGQSGSGDTPKPGSDSKAEGPNEPTGTGDNESGFGPIV